MERLEVEVGGKVYRELPGNTYRELPGEEMKNSPHGRSNPTVDPTFEQLDGSGLNGMHRWI